MLFKIWKNKILIESDFMKLLLIIAMPVVLLIDIVIFIFMAWLEVQEFNHMKKKRKPTKRK